MQQRESDYNQVELKIVIQTRTGQQKSLNFRGQANDPDCLLVQTLLKLNKSLAAVQDMVVTNAGLKPAAAPKCTIDEVHELIKHDVTTTVQYCKTMTALNSGFGKPLNSTLNQQKRENTLTIISNIISNIYALCENNYLDEALTILHSFIKALTFLNNQIDLLKEKEKRSLKLYCETIRETYPMALKELAYCQLQTEKYMPAAMTSAEALKLMKHQFPGQDNLINFYYEISHKWVLAIHNIHQGNIVLAKDIIDQNLSVYDRSKEKVLDMASIYSCKRLAEDLFGQEQFELAIKYLKVANNSLDLFLFQYQSKHSVHLPYHNANTPKRVYATDLAWQRNCKKELLAAIAKTETILFERCINRMRTITATYPSFFTEDSIVVHAKDLAVELAAQDKIVSTLIFKLLVAEAILDVQFIEPDKIRFKSLQQLNETLLIRIFDQVIRILTQKPLMTAEEKSSKPSPPPTPSPTNAELDALVAASYNLYKSTPTKTKTAQSISTKAVLNKNDTTDSSLNIAVNEIAKITGIERDQIYSLANEPYIPRGYWFGYLDVNRLPTDVAQDHIKEARSIIERGLLANYGQAVANAKNELKDSKYTFKLRLLGPNGKGEIRFYGWVKTIDREKKLIIFDHAELKSHKKINLPKTERSLENKGMRQG